jgi:hypothetical protein
MRTRNHLGRRIGVAVSVLWFVGFAWFLWPAPDDPLINDYSRACTGQLNSDRDELQSVQPDLQEAFRARSLANYNKCETRAKVLFIRQAARNKRYKGWVVSFDLFTIIVAWGTTWSVMVMIKWAKRTFLNKDPRRSNV